MLADAKAKAPVANEEPKPLVRPNVAARRAALDRESKATAEDADTATSDILPPVGEPAEPTPPSFAEGSDVDLPEPIPTGEQPLTSDAERSVYTLLDELRGLMGERPESIEAEFVASDIERILADSSNELDDATRDELMEILHDIRPVVLAPATPSEIDQEPAWGTGMPAWEIEEPGTDGPLYGGAPEGWGLPWSDLDDGDIRDRVAVPRPVATGTEDDIPAGIFDDRPQAGDTARLDDDQLGREPGGTIPGAQLEDLLAQGEDAGEPRPALPEDDPALRAANPAVADRLEAARQAQAGAEPAQPETIDTDDGEPAQAAAEQTGGEPASDQELNATNARTLAKDALNKLAEQLRDLRGKPDEYQAYIDNNLEEFKRAFGEALTYAPEDLADVYEEFERQADELARNGGEYPSEQEQEQTQANTRRRGVVGKWLNRGFRFAKSFNPRDPNLDRLNPRENQ
jgi:hypothetical protein